MTGYYPMTAQDLARARRQRLAKLSRDGVLLAHVVDQLRAGWSPQQSAGRLKLDDADGNVAGRLCHETIYRHVYGPAGRAENLYMCLPRARRRRAARHGRRPHGQRIPQERGIACRPAEVSVRARLSAFGWKKTETGQSCWLDVGSRLRRYHYNCTRLPITAPSAPPPNAMVVMIAANRPRTGTDGAPACALAWLATSATCVPSSSSTIAP